MYCKCCFILCLPCPDNCINFSNHLPSSPSNESESSKADGKEKLELEERNSDQNPDKIESVRTKVYIYANGSITKITEILQLSVENIAFREVKGYFKCYAIMTTSSFLRSGVK